MKKIILFVITDILKNKIVLIYTLLLAAFAWTVFSLEDNSTKGILSLLNIVLLTVPLVCIIFSTIYIFNSGEFIELLVSQPVKRRTIWISLFLGLAMSLCMAFMIGVGIPVLLFCSNTTGLSIILVGLLTTIIFCSLAVLCSIVTRDKSKGIGLAIVLWLFLTLIYDGLVLFLMFQLADYPIEKPMVVVSALNPIDLARIVVILQIDVSALMGYTGAVFKNIFGSTIGLLLSLFIMIIWAIVPFGLSLHKFNKKDL
jgi:Cu-processing system permease protein